MNVYVIHCRLCPGVGNFNLAFLGGEFDPGMLSLSSGINVF